MRLIAENLAGERGGDVLFDEIGFEIDSGSALIVTGPNGVGKSTLLRVVAGLLPAAEGTVRLEGGQADQPVAAHCHYLGHLNAMKSSLTVIENLRFWRAFCSEPAKQPEEALQAVGLEELADLPFGVLSAGQRRRVAVARLLVSRRPVWILDEPTSSLDDASARQFTRLLEDHLAGGGMALAATHQPLVLAGRTAELHLERATHA